ncbi:MAG: hypothetical protein MZV70_45875 [Desulfobacterales bacterium]|nr:hypothetical protein [Desulfobacterales bacterium]
MHFFQTYFTFQAIFPDENNRIHVPADVHDPLHPAACPWLLAACSRCHSESVSRRNEESVAFFYIVTDLSIPVTAIGCSSFVITGIPVSSHA